MIVIFNPEAIQFRKVELSPEIGEVVPLKKDRLILGKRIGKYKNRTS